MKVLLRKTGGVAGLRLQGEIDLEELPAELKARSKAVLQPEALKAAQAKPQNARMVDAQHYEVSLIPDDASAPVDTYAFSEAQDAPEVLEVLDAVMHEVIKRKQKSP